MKEKFVRTLRKTGTSLAINLPPEVIRLLKLKAGDILRIEVEKIKNK